MITGTNFTMNTLVPAVNQLTHLDSRSLVVLDEVGKMQLSCPELAAALNTVFHHSQACLVATIPREGLHPDLDFVEALRRRSDVSIVTVQKASREDAFQKALHFVEDALN